MKSAPKKIVRILTRLNIGGPSVHAAILSTQLDPRRFSTCLVVGAPDVSEGDLSPVLQEQSVRLIRVSGLRRSLHPWHDGLAFVALLRILWRERPQLIHTHMAKAGALGRFAGRCYNLFGPGRRAQARATLIHTFHGHVLDGYFSPWRSRLFTRIERWLARRTDCLIAVSPQIRQSLEHKRIGRAGQWRVIPLGLHLAPFTQLPLSNGARPLRVGLVGRLVAIKHPSLFLEALSLMARTGPASLMQGVVVGDGPLRPSLEDAAKRLGLDGVVQFLGWQHDLRSVYEHVDVVCLTSWNEGTPVALIEAMAAGRAVVATNVGGVPDLLGDPEPAPVGPIPAGGYRVAQRGLLVRPGDANGLAQALRRLASDHALRGRLAEAARAHVLQGYGSARLIDEISTLYDQLDHTCRAGGGR